jgi:hypothetical protein
MGELLLTLGFSGLVATAAGVINGWIAAGYLGVVCAGVVMLLCAGQFARSHWPGLLFWFGAALGACVAQGFVLWLGDGASDGGVSLATNGAIGAVFGMLVGGAAADAYGERHPHDYA